MVSLTRSQQLVLYSLGLCYQQLNKRFEDKPLEASVSKIAFIDMVLSSGLFAKKARALYKNLETLEKKKLIVYGHKHIHFTQRGYTAFGRLIREFEPFVAQTEFWRAHWNNFHRKIQAYLKGSFIKG